MAETTVKHKLELLIQTSLSDESKQKVGQQLKGILEGAAIGFNEAETKKNLKPIINTIQKMFEKAEMKFDADKLLGMPSQEALQELANITADRFQTAFDRALERSGGVKIELGDINLSGMTDPLERVVEEVADINRRLATETKKSVDEINLAVNRLNKAKPKQISTKVVVDGVETEVIEEVSKAEQIATKIEKTLSAVGNQKYLTTEKGAISALNDAMDKYSKSVSNGDAWEVQYQHLVSFVSKYEAMAAKIKPIIDTNNPEFKTLYDILSPKAGAAKISLENFVSVARNKEELAEYKNQPWARESTLKNIEKTLKSGIAVKGDSGDNHDDAPPKEPPKQVPPEPKQDDKKINSKVSIDNGESDAEKAARLAREQEEAALREVERKRIEQERIAEAERAAAEQRRVAEEKAIAEARKVYAENIYRVVYEPDDEEDRSRDERKAAYGGVEIWTSSKDVANTYADGQENPAMLHGSVSAKNAYFIDAGGAKWNEFSKMKVLTPVGVDTEGKTKFDKTSLKSVFPELFKRMDNKEFGQDEDVQTELYRLIKELGYDSIITRNVIDSNNAESYREKSTIYSIIDDRILKVLDAFAVEEQDERGVTTFEETPRRENIPGYYKMPDVTSGGDISVEELERQKQLEEEVLKITKDINATSAREAVIKEELVDLIEKYYKICVKLGNAQSMAIDFKGQSYNKSELGDLQSQLRGYIYRYAENFGDDVSMFGTKKLQKIASDGISKYQSLKPHIDELNQSLEKKNVLEASDNSSAEVAETNAQTDALEQQNEELKENIQLKMQGDTQDAVTPPGKGDKVDTTDDQTQLNNLKTAIGNVEGAVNEKTAAFEREETKVKEIVGHEIDALGGLESKISAINNELDKLTKKANTDIGSELTINVNHKAEDVEGSGVSINQEELKSTLENVIYKIKLADGDKGAESNKVAIDGNELKSVLENIVFDVKLAHDVEEPDNKPVVNDGKKDSATPVDNSLDNDSQWKTDVTTLLTRIKVHTHNTVRQVRDGVVPKMSTVTTDVNGDWAKESTLSSAIKPILETIRNNTAKIDGPNSDAIKGTAVNNYLSAITRVLNEINSKISGKISGVVKSDTKTPNGVSAKTGKNKDGTISHGQAEGDTGSMQKLFDYYYWIEEQIEQFENNERYVVELKKVQAQIIPKINAFYKELEETGKEDPAWMAPLSEKHNLHMSKILGKNEQFDSASTRKKALDILKEEYKLKKEIFALEQKGAVEDDVAPLKEKLGIYQSIRETIEFNMTDDDLLLYASSAATEMSKGEHQLTAQEIAANIRARNVEASAENRATKATETYVAKLQKEIDKLRASQAQDGLDDRIKTALQQEIDLRKKLIQLRKDGNALDGESEAYQIKEVGLNTARVKSSVAQEAKDAKKNASSQASADNSAESKLRTKLMALAREQGTKDAMLAKLGDDASGTDEYKSIENSRDEIKEKIRAELESHGKLNSSLETELETTRKIAEERKARSLNEADARKKYQDALKAELAQHKKDANANKVASSMRGGRDALFTASTLGISDDVFNANKDIQSLTGALNKLAQVESKLAANDWTFVDDEDGSIEEQKKKLAELTGEVNKYSAAVKALVANAGKFGDENSTSLNATLGGNAGVKDQLLSAAQKQFGSKFKFEEYNEQLGEITGTLKVGTREYQKVTVGANQFTKAIRASHGPIKKTETFMESFKRKLGEISTYFSASSVIFKAVGMLKQGISYVREIDFAMTELKKVTSETEEVYDEFLKTASKTAEKVGSTMQNVISSTADWARLGYSMEQAAKFAESTQILMNVSEFTDVSQATDTLISSVQAFGYTAETSMEVVDLLNTIGNNYAISTADLAQSLTKSSASLVAAGGDLAEAAALTATANAIIQDADSVGTALKTTSLRLRGTDVKVLEEEGLDSEGAVTSKSKLQSKVKALSGVDILTATGEYKSTYKILSDIADVWESMNDMDQAALLELISGKRNSSVIAAILQSPEELKEAYEDAMDAEGSALKENERYMDSIQGRIDQFNSSLQAMWTDTLNSDIVKFFVDLATQLVKIVDAVGPLNIAVVGLFTYLEKKHGIFDGLFKPAEEGLDGLKKNLAKAQKDLDSATQKFEQTGSAEDLEEKKSQEQRVKDISQKIKDKTETPVDPEVDTLAKERDDFAQEVDALKTKRDELKKAVESDSPDDMLKLIEIDTTSIDDEIAEAQNKLEEAKQELEKAKAEPVTRQVNGGTRMNKDRDIHIADASKEIAEIEKDLDSLQQKKADTIHYAAQFDLAEMDESIGVASDKLNGMTAAIDAKTAAQNASNAATSAGVVADQAAESAQEAKIATTWKELAAQIMSGEVTKDNIGANIKSILVTKLATTALGEKMASILGVTTAELVNIPVTQLLTAGFSALASAIWAVLAPLLPFIAIAAGAVVAVVALVKVIDAVWVTAGEAKEKLEELNSEVNNLESDLDSLNSELKTTQERMEELLSKDSLSFVEQEELNNLKLQNEYLERQIDLQELILKNKKAERTSVAKNVIDKTWDSKSFGKEDYQVDWDDGVIKKDDFWSVGVSGKDAINKGIKKYNEQKEIVAETEQAYIDSLEKYGSGSYDADFYKKQLEIEKDLLTKQAGGIDMVLGDMSNIIAENELQYGDDKEINKYLDEYYAMSLKWQEAQGVAGKSDIIKSIFGSTDEDTKNLKKQLDEIAGSDLDNAEKQTKAQKLIQGALDATNGSYQRLQTTVSTLKMSADELAESFIAASEAPDISTIGGILQIFADGEEILKSEANNLQVAIDEAGEAITWDSLFKGPEGEREADNLKVASILEGADQAVRDQFIRLIEEVENGKMGVDEALSKWKMVGVDKAISTLNTEFETLNNEMFPDAADEISGLIDTLSELKSAFESVANTMDTFKGAQKEYNETGRVSIQTALELMSSTDEWDKVLNITEDSITLVDGAEKALMETQLKSISEQMQTAADMAKIKLDAAVQAQNAKAAFDAEANAASNLNTAEQNVNTTQQNANITTQQRTGAMGTLAEQTYSTAISELDYAANDSTVQTAESVKAKAIGLVSAAIVGLDAFIDALLTDKTMKEAWSEYQEARDVVIDDANSKTTTVGDLRKDYEKKQAMANVAKNGDTYSEFGTNWDGNDDEKKEAEDAFQKEMDYWENRIGANQARYEQLQNEIDLLEAKGQKADASFYEEQIKLENERLFLLGEQKAAAQAHLAILEEGSEEWWSTAKILNDLESDIDDVTASIVDLQDAIGEIDAYKFDEFNTRLDNLTSKLGTIRDLIAPNGEEDWFDDQGNWTDAGIAVAGTYLHDLETYKQGYQETMDELAKYESPYAGNEEYYASLGIHSEQEWYDKTEELISQQYDFAESISDTEQSIVEMYESSIDAVEKYVDTLIDGYNDYIDSVKEALDAERKLFDFKKNVQKQAKDIAEIERRIASLSGSTNKADIAERRKLEAQLYESRESLDDTYYDHAKDSQNDALDAEASAYEETMTKMVEGMRTSLQEATADMDTFLNNVTIAVSMNADTVLEKYKETNVYLDPALTNPWENAKTKVGEYGDKATNLMDVWKNDGYFAEFSSTAGTNLSSPWSNGTDAANTFKNSVSTVMSDVVSNISTNVQAASGELSKLYQQIIDTERRAASANVTTGGSGTGAGGGSASYVAPKQYHVTATLAMSGKTLQVTKSNEGATKAKSLAQQAILGEYEKYQKSKGISMDRYESSWLKTYRSKVKYDTQYYAKGTTGTKRDEWAITDEPQFGDELVLVPGKDGNLSFMRKGTGVVPADLTANLIEWGQFTPDSLNLGGGVNVNMINNAVNKPEFNFAFDALVKAERIDENTLPEVKRFVQQEINSLVKQMNYAIKGKGGR